MDATLRTSPDVAVIRGAEPVPGLGVLPVRSFVLLGREPVLVDTGVARESEAFVAALETVLDPADLRWIVVTHADADHAGALPALLGRAPKARVVLNQISTGKLSGTVALPMPRVTWVNAGQALDAGDRVLRFLRPPMYDCPSTVALFDERTRVLFASDAFGAIVPSDVPTFDDAHESSCLEGMSFFCRANSPWLSDVRPERYEASLREVASLGASWLLSSHLPAVPAAKVGRVLARAAKLPAEGPVALASQDALDAALARAA
ncbi:MAG: MBL fold metallo-hydrolase [Thermoanaerobaculia bacterium]